MSHPPEYRVDYAREALARPVRRDDGFVVYDACVTRAGVFRYRRADGTEVRELRHPDDVFASDSLATLRLVPATLQHPAFGSVTADRAREVMRGTTGENVRRDADRVLVPIAVHDRETATRIDAGDVETSCGYHCRVEATPGVYNGEPYDVRQRDIRYDHVAVGLPRGDARAGSAASVRLDGAAIQITDEAPTAPTGAPRMSTRKIEVAGASYDVPEAVAARLDSLAADATRAKAEADAARDALSAATKAAEQARQDSAKAEADAKAKADAEVETRVKALVELRDKAARVLGSAARLDGKSADEIKRAVIAARVPGVDLTGKGAEYVDAAFDLATRADAVATIAAAAGITNSGSAAQGEIRADQIRNSADLDRFVGQQRAKSLELYRTPTAA